MTFRGLGRRAEPVRNGRRLTLFLFLMLGVWLLVASPALAGNTTNTTVSCMPVTGTVGQGNVCTATVTDTGVTVTAPMGTISFSDSPSNSGTFSGNGTCTLVAVNANSSACGVTYTPSVATTVTIQAIYIPSDTHMSSNGTRSLVVSPASGTTSSSVSCAPSSVTVGQSSACTATVSDTGASPTQPAGTMNFSASPSGSGTFSSGGICTLSPSTSTQSSCQVTYTPSGATSVTVHGQYVPSDGHSASSGSTGLTVTGGASTTGAGTGSGAPLPAFLPFLGGQFTSLFAASRPTSTFFVSRGVQTLLTGQPALSVTTQGACQLSAREVPVALPFGRASAAKQRRAAKKRKGRKGLFGGVPIRAPVAGRYLIPLNLTPKAKRLERRLARKKARRAAAALFLTLTASDSFRVGCTPLSVGTTTFGSGGPTIPKVTGGGVPAGPPSFTTVHVGAITLQIPTAGPGGGGVLSSATYGGDLTIAGKLQGSVSLTVTQPKPGQGFPSLVSAVGNLSTSGGACATGFTVGPRFPSRDPNLLPFSNASSFALSQNAGTLGHSQQVIIEGAVGATQGSVLVIANGGGLCSEEASFGVKKNGILHVHQS